MFRVGFLFLVVLLTGCASSDSDDCAGDVCYRVTFEETWNAANFPTRYPTNSHFSPLIGASHGPAVRFFTLNQSASNGIESMAETGAVATLRAEIEIAINAGNALEVIQGDGIINSESSIIAELTVSTAYPLVTLVSMVAPSPDWFTGVESLDLRDTNGNFFESLVVDLIVYDAGSDQGVTFNSVDAEDNSVVTLLSCADLVNHCGFTDGLGTDGVLHIGRFVFEKLP